MALIVCPECGAKVSDKAPTCVQCGVPLAAARETTAAGAALTTTQAASKKLKAHSLISGSLLVVGIVFLIADVSSSPSGGASLFTFGWVLISLIWFATTKLRIWWHHS